MADFAEPGVTRELRIEYMRLDRIKRDPSNPKDHDLGALAESLKRFGFVAPMGLNERTGLLLFGHGRLDDLEDMRLRGENRPRGIGADPADGMWMAPVIRGIELSEQDGKAYVIADNRLVELGGWNEPMLAERLIEIAGAAPAGTLRGTGFDDGDVQALIDALAGPEQFPAVGEDDPETPAEAAAARPLTCPHCGASFRLVDALAKAAEGAGEG